MAKCMRTGLAVALLCGFSSCVDLRARAYAGYIETELSGEVGLEGGVGPVVATSNVDVQDSLGLGKEGSPYFRADLGTGIVNITGSVFSYDAKGDGLLTANFGGISAGVPVQTDLEFLNIKGAITFDLINIGPVRLSPGVAVDYFDWKMQVTTTALNVTEQLNAEVPVPLLFAQGEVTLGPVAALVDFGGMKASWGDIDGTYYDLEALLRVNPFSKIELIAGYRWIAVESTGESNGQRYDADVELQGWFVGGGLAF